MPHFTWHDQGLSEDCQSLAAMAARFEEAAALMRRLDQSGFRLERPRGQQHITHTDSTIFAAFGFLDETGPGRQLELVESP
ncbi:MAG: hypothetical protein TE42_02800 [Candidatus Synechococcus spongiarum SP3]|uniref:Uncharacterized protein n=1 Tax=Candidatus Synechococcus spongiarum SP3 TaxID=1604020 RepID=A0A0G2HM46_9SYNE|nr:MAG: hypothetical protein TE42_02800 [Candidatus Synechococcus spongiarum SP3]